MVITAWARALRRGDVEAAAGYFALPSRMVNFSASGQPVVLSIRSRRDAVLANESLSCGAVLLSTRQHEGFVDALFLLTGRKGPGGSSRGCVGSARTYFVVAAGRIVDWIRAPSEPGDNGTPATPV